MKALVIPGGGAAGISTAGHLLAFEELKQEYDFITGTSSGCLNAGMYHQGNIDAVVDAWMSIRNQDVYDFSPFTITGAFQKGGGVMDSRPLRNFLAKRIIKTKLKPQPFLINTTDEETRVPYQRYASELTQEELITLCWASASIPALFPVVTFQDKFLCDGGITANAAIKEAVSQGADTIYVLLPRRTRPQRPGDLLARIGNIISTMMEQLVQREIRMVQAYNQVDGKRHISLYVVSPTEYTDIGLADFDSLGSVSDRQKLINFHKEDALKQLSAQLKG